IYTGWTDLEKYIPEAVIKSVQTALVEPMDLVESLVAECVPAKPTIDGLGFEYGAWDREPPPVEFLVDGILPRACVAMFHGRADSLKTWLMFSLAKSVAYGESWLGRATKKCKVGIVDYETGRANLVRRLYRLRAGTTPNLGAKSFASLKPSDPAFW